MDTIVIANGIKEQQSVLSNALPPSSYARAKAIVRENAITTSGISPAQATQVRSLLGMPEPDKMITSAHFDIHYCSNNDDDRHNIPNISPLLTQLPAALESAYDYYLSLFPVGPLMIAPGALDGRLQVIIYSLQENEVVDPGADEEVIAVDPQEQAYGQTAPTGMIEIDSSLAADTLESRIRHVAAHELFHKFEASFMRSNFVTGDKFDLWYLEGMAEAASMYATGGLISNPERIQYYLKDTQAAALPFFEASYITVTFWLWLWAKDINWIHRFMTTYQASISPNQAFETFAQAFIGDDGSGIGSSLLGVWGIEGLLYGGWNKAAGTAQGATIFPEIIDAGTGQVVSTERDDSNLITAGPRETYGMTKVFSVIRGGVALSTVSFAPVGYGGCYLNFTVSLDDDQAHWSFCIGLNGGPATPTAPSCTLNGAETFAFIAIATAFDWRNESDYNDNFIKIAVAAIVTCEQP